MAAIVHAGLFMTLLLRLCRSAIVLAALGTSALAVLALLGAVVPVFDLINHAQIVLFPALVIGLLAVLLLRGRLRQWVGACTILGLLASGSVMVPEVLGGTALRPTPFAAQTIRMMSHNLFGMNYEMDKVQAAILGEDVDIIVLQEYFGEQANALHPLLIERYPYWVRCRGGKRANLGLYSRFPFEQVVDGACPDNAYVTARTGHILARFKTPEGKPFSIITTHMDWPVPVTRQGEQLAALSSVLDGIEGPVILAGDFNSTPWSYALRRFVAGNALTRETMNLPTFPMQWFYLGAWRDTLPFLPLDHVMTRGGVVVHELHAGAPTASDHLPVVFEFTVR